MARCRQYNQHMEDLMTAAPNIKTSGSPLLGDSSRIQRRPSDIQYPLQDNPVKSDTLTEMLDTVQFDAV